MVFAGARVPTAQSLKDLSAKHPNVHAVKLTSGDEANNAAAIAEIQRIAGHLDVIIANAGEYTFSYQVNHTKDGSQELANITVP